MDLMAGFQEGGTFREGSGKAAGNSNRPLAARGFCFTSGGPGPGKGQANGGPRGGKYLLKRLAEICKTILAGSRARSRTDREHSCRGSAFRNKVRRARRIVVHSWPENPVPFRRESFTAGCIFRIERDHAGIPQALLGER